MHKTKSCMHRWTFKWACWASTTLCTWFRASKTFWIKSKIGWEWGIMYCWTAERSVAWEWEGSREWCLIGWSRCILWQRWGWIKFRGHTWLDVWGRRKMIRWLWLCFLCSKPLTTYQKYFKSSWIAHSKATINSNQYSPDVTWWTCKCGQQKYNCHCLCKHLVQAVPPLPVKFWGQVYWHQSTPIYWRPALVPILKGQSWKQQKYVDPDDGSIIDGDDHVLVGNPEVLRGGGG